jgi:hypothetical protein
MAGAHFNIEQELRAAFFWSSLSQSERERISRTGASAAQEILQHAPTQTFDLTRYSSQSGKKNFAENLSHHLAIRLAHLLRDTFPGILPDETGKGRESKARTARKYKKLDVNYSTPRLGLALGVSIKTVNARDGKTKRFNKNFTRIDGELRAEAADYHERQPYTVMVAILFMPKDACLDSTERSASSFGTAVRDFRYRAGRSGPTDSVMLFERFFIGLYSTAASDFGDVVFFDVKSAPPRSGIPVKNTLSVDQLVRTIIQVYDEQNNPPFEWEGGSVDDVAQAMEDDPEDADDA